MQKCTMYLGMLYRWIGTFASAKEAARAYDEAAMRLHGPKARTNFMYQKPLQGQGSASDMEQVGRIPFDLL